MNFVEIITKLFGNKSQKDMRAIMPYVEKIKAAYEEIDKLDNDVRVLVRGRSWIGCKPLLRIRSSASGSLKASIDALEIDKREKVYDEVDKAGEGDQGGL